MPSDLRVLFVRTEDGRAEIRVGERAPVTVDLPRALPASDYVGIYAKDAKLVLEDLVVELFP